MQDQSSRRSPPPRSGPEPDAGGEREAEAAVRREHGIDRLEEGEELTDDASFERMQEEWTRAQSALAAAGPPRRPRAGSQEELLLLEIVSEPPSGSAPGGARGREGAGEPPATPEQVAALEEKLLAAEDRDAIARLAVQLGRAHARACGLFVVHHGLIMGLCGGGEGLEQRIQGVVVPVDSPSLFAEVVRQRAPLRFGGPASRMDERLLRALDRSDARDRLLAPVAIRGRIVNLLYADNGRYALAETSVGALRALASCVARAYERAILARKRAGA